MLLNGNALKADEAVEAMSLFERMRGPLVRILLTGVDAGNDGRRHHRDAA